MKLHIQTFPRTLGTALIAAVFVTGIAYKATAGSMGLVSIKVEESSDKDRSRSNTLNRNNRNYNYNRNNQNTTETTDKRSMTITLTNRSPKPMENLTVKYWLFSRDLQSRDGQVIAKGEKNLTIPALGSETFDAATATIKQKSVRNNNNNRNTWNNRQFQSATGDKSGERYAGYGVVVLDSDGKIVAEDFTAGGMRELVAKELPRDDNPWGLRKW